MANPNELLLPIDHFAAAALQALIKRTDKNVGGNQVNEHLADEAWKIANEMVKKRSLYVR